MRLALADHVHGAVVDGDLVLLDVRDDVYFCLPAGAHDVTLNGRLLTVTPDALGRALADASLVKPEAGGDTITEILAPPKRTARAVLDDDPALKAASVKWRHVVALAQSALRARRSEKQPFATRLVKAGVPEPAVTRALLADLAVFRRLSPWLPVDGACLFRSQMLRAYLCALGHQASWRFGVRTWPFRAHCWLQLGDLALDDEAERLASFHPILAV